MREGQSADAKAHLRQLLSEVEPVERGETIIITRDGLTIARLVPETDQRRPDIEKAMAELAAFRQAMPAIALDDILAARHERHQY